MTRGEVPGAPAPAQRAGRLSASLLVGLPLLANLAALVLFGRLFAPGRAPTAADFHLAATQMAVALLALEVAALFLVRRAAAKERLTLPDLIAFRGERMGTYLATALLGLLPTLLAGWLYVRAQSALGAGPYTAGLGPADVVLWYVVVPLVAAVAEETVWRGYALPRLGGRRGLLWTSLSFSLYHGVFNPLALVATFLQGLVWGWAYQRSGSTAPAMALHFISRFLWLVPGIG